MNDVWCATCGDPFDPVEYNIANMEGDNFCSDSCADKHEDWLVYEEARYGGAPVN